MPFDTVQSVLMPYSEVYKMTVVHTVEYISKVNGSHWVVSCEVSDNNACMITDSVTSLVTYTILKYMTVVPNVSILILNVILLYHYVNVNCQMLLINQ